MISKSALETLNELVEVAEKATPGPWHSYWRLADNGDTNCGVTTERGYAVYRAPRYQKEEQWKADGDFAIAMRNSIPALKAILQSLEPTEARADVIEKYAKRLNDGIIISAKPMSAKEAREEQRTILRNILTDFASELAASPVTKAETQEAVAWRAWRSGPHFDCWVYWEEDIRDSLNDCPEYSQFQALYAHPSPQPEAATIDAEAAASELHDWLLFRLDREMGIPDVAEIATHIRKHASEHAGEQGWVNAEDMDKLVRELDVAINGEAGAAKQASLCDIVAQVKNSNLVMVPRKATDAMIRVADYHHAQDGMTSAILWELMVAAAPDSAGEK